MLKELLITQGRRKQRTFKFAIIKKDPFSNFLLETKIVNVICLIKLYFSEHV